MYTKLEVMKNENQWYDSVWLSKYLAAKEYIIENCPERYDEFMASFNVLRTDPNFKVKHLPGLLNFEALDLIKKIINNIPVTSMKQHEVETFGRYIMRNHPVFLKMQANLTKSVSEWVGEEVEPCYNFLSLYTQLGVCEPHMDAPEAKWTLDICIDQSEPWPIHFSQIVPWPEQHQYRGENWQQAIKSDPSLRFETRVLEPGNAILFSGSSQWHYRDALPKTSNLGFCNLLFFHYIPKGSSEVVNPKNWARLFGISELDEIFEKYTK